MISKNSKIHVDFHWIKTMLVIAFFISVSNSAFAQDLENIKKAKPFEIHGSASVAVGYYNANSFNSTRKPYSYSIMASPTISLYGIQIPFNFTFTEGSNQVKNPFAQFGVNPYYKWVKAYLIWTNMTWSPTTLNGKTFLGAGVEINPSYFRFGAMGGRFNPAVVEDLTKLKPPIPQYKRIGFAFKIGVGKTDNFFDLILLKGKDYANSIPKPNDYLNNSPAENLVVGAISHQTFWKKKITWNADGSVSAFTRDLNSKELDLGNGGGAKLLRFFMPVRLSTGYSWAVHNFIGVKFKITSLSFDYNRVQPEYQSMGADYLANDLQRFTLAQSMSFDTSKWVVALNESYQHDNLSNTKAARTHRFMLSAVVSYNVAKWGFTFSFNNFDLFQQDGMKTLTDTTRLKQLNNTFTFSPRYTIVNEKFVHNIFTTLSYQRNDDLNTFTAPFTNSQTFNDILGYVISVNKLRFTASPSFTFLYSKTQTIALMNFGPSLALSKAFIKGKLNTGINTGIIWNRLNDNPNFKTLNVSFNLGYRFDQHHSIRTRHSFMNNFMNAGMNTHEFKGDVGYTYSF